MISKLHISHQLKNQIQHNTRTILRQEPKASESSKNDTVPTASTDTCIESSGLGMSGRNSRSSRCWFRARGLGPSSGLRAKTIGFGLGGLELTV